ncbi:hypothetical protein Tco_0420910 [Tanacetum coccineum]
MSMSISCINPGDHLLPSSTNVLVEDFIYQIENKNTKKGNAMYYPRFNQASRHFVMAIDLQFPQRNKDEESQLTGAILPAEFNQRRTSATLNHTKSNYAICFRKRFLQRQSKVRRKADSDATTKQKPPTVPKEKKGKKTGKGKQKAKELETISVAILIEAEQLKIITKRRRKETHSSHASGSGIDEGTGVSPGVPDAHDYDSDDDISWKSSKDDQDEDKNKDDENAQDDDDNAKSGDDELKSQDDQDDDDEAQTESEDDGDDFIHPKLTYDDETTHEEETDEDDTFNPIVYTPSHVSSSDDENSDNEVEGMDVEGEKLDEYATYVEDQSNEEDRDTNENLEGRDYVKADVVLPQVQATQEIEDTHVTLTPVNPDGQQQSSSISSGFVSNMVNPNQDTGVDVIFGHNAEATSLVDIPVTAIAEPSFFAPTNSLEDNFSEFKQTNQYAEALSSIPGIVDQYLANEMKEALDVAVQLKSDIKRQLYKALVDAYEADKILLDTYGDTVIIKRPRDGADDDQEPSAGTDRGSKTRRPGKEPETTSALREKTTTTARKTTTGSKTHKQSTSHSTLVEETMQSIDVFEAPAHQEFETGVHDKQTEEEVHPLPDWFQQPKRHTFLLNSKHRKSPVPAVHEFVQPCLSNLARRQDPRESFDELTDTPFDFSAFVMNRLNKVTKPHKKLDWINPEGRQYPHDLRKPLPLVPNSQGRHVIPFHHFINNYLEYLYGDDQAATYSTSLYKTKVCKNIRAIIKWIEDLVPNSMWSQVIVSYDKFALWGISHWGKKRRQFYAFATTRESARDIY